MRRIEKVNQIEDRKVKLNMKKAAKIMAVLMAVMLCITLTACGGPKESAFKDSTAKIEKTTAKGSLGTVKGKYLQNGTKGNYVVYASKGKGFNSQHGKYEFKSGKISMTYYDTGAALTYTINDDQKDKNTKILKNKNIKITCTYKNGTAGLHSASKAFEGTYSLGTGTKIVFKKDGTFRQVQTFTYKVSGNTLKLTYNKDTQKYKWTKSGNKLIIKQNGTTVEKLVPSK